MKQTMLKPKQAEQKKVAQVTPVKRTITQLKHSRYKHYEIIGNHGVLLRATIQAKLKVSQPGDKYEQEADQVADAAMRLKEPQLYRQIVTEEDEERFRNEPVNGQITPLVHRQALEDKDNKVEEKEFIQANKVFDRAPQSVRGVTAQINVVRGGGQPLLELTRAFFEPRFRCDFSRVRIHTGYEAQDAAAAVNARAFTIGQDIVFNAREYAPESSQGRSLLAHELTHVVQQARVGDAILNRQRRSPSLIRPKVKRDDFLRRLARNPREALRHWNNLSAGEQTAVVTYMTQFYNLTFSRHFLKSAKSGHKSLYHWTNWTSLFTSENLRRRGYYFVGTSQGTFGVTEIWVHPTGKELWVFYGSRVKAHTESKAPQPQKVQHPVYIDTKVPSYIKYGPHTALYGPVIIEGRIGSTTWYQDGAFEFVVNGKVTLTYRPTGKPNEYVRYNERGWKESGTFIVKRAELIAPPPWKGSGQSRLE